MKGIAVNPVLRVQNAMYRLKVLISRADLPAATAWRDTMLLYNKMYADPSQQEELQYTLARYERLAGNNAEAERILHLLADYSRSRGNQARMARYYRSLADVLRAEGRYAEAADCYRLYAEAADSAQVATSNAQLNRLSRLYRLDELEQEKRVALAEQSRARTLAGSALIVAVLLLALCVLLVVHHRRLRQKNRELVARIRSQEEAEQRAEEAARRAEAEQPADELSRSSSAACKSCWPTKKCCAVPAWGAMSWPTCWAPTAPMWPMPWPPAPSNTGVCRSTSQPSVFVVPAT